MQAKLFGEEMDAVLARYRNRQITGAEVAKALVGLAKKVRDARHRHEELGLSEEEAAFYDALAGSAEDSAVDPTDRRRSPATWSRAYAPTYPWIGRATRIGRRSSAARSSDCCASTTTRLRRSPGRAEEWPAAAA